MVPSYGVVLMSLGVVIGMVVARPAYAQVPTIGGTYLGVFDSAITECNPPQPDDFGSLDGRVSIVQAGAAFDGSGVGVVDFGDGFVATAHLTVAGTVDSGGDLTGTFEYTYDTTWGFSSSGNGTLTGVADGTTLELHMVGLDTDIFGTVCVSTTDFNGTVTRVPAVGSAGLAILATWLAAAARKSARTRSRRHR